MIHSSLAKGRRARVRNPSPHTTHLPTYLSSNHTTCRTTLLATSLCASEEAPAERVAPHLVAITGRNPPSWQCVPNLSHLIAPLLPTSCILCFPNRSVATQTQTQAQASPSTSRFTRAVAQLSSPPHTLAPSPPRLPSATQQATGAKLGVQGRSNSEDNTTAAECGRR